ncbi:MAG: AgmX/PglI C-terminal domain-containing protein [Polyangiaceae bacterium]|nr:AgmX/PglI C-terminal domain-containing protein [Polyangiaceae bacterium]
MLAESLRGGLLVLLVAVLGVGGCGSNSSPEANSGHDAADGSWKDGEEVTEDEAAAMASIEEYLADEGETHSDSTVEDQDAAEATTAVPQGGAVARRDQLWALVKAKRTAVADCYRAAKKEDPKIGTKIAVRFVLKPDGTLKQDPEVVADMTDITSSIMRQCTVEVLKSIEYPPHPNGMETTFTYPFGF